jgi:hypothetical protein
VERDTDDGENETKMIFLMMRPNEGDKGRESRECAIYIYREREITFHWLCEPIHGARGGWVSIAG